MRHPVYIHNQIQRIDIGYEGIWETAVQRKRQKWCQEITPTSPPTLNIKVFLRFLCKTQLQISGRGDPVIWPLCWAGSPCPAVEGGSPACINGSASKENSDELGVLWQQNLHLACQNPISAAPMLITAKNHTVMWLNLPYHQEYCLLCVRERKTMQGTTKQLPLTVEINPMEWFCSSHNHTGKESMQGNPYIMNLHGRDLTL